MSIVHVLPVNDLIDHDEVGTDCACIPHVEHVPGDGDGWLITHHSLDGREHRKQPAGSWAAGTLAGSETAQNGTEA